MQELGTVAHVILAQEMETGEWLVWDQPGAHIEIFVS